MRTTQETHGTTWVDCNKEELPHVWMQDQVDRWFYCLHCPCATRSELDAPPAFLGLLAIVKRRR